MPHPDIEHMTAILLRHVASKGPMPVFEAHYSHGAHPIYGRHHRQAMALLVERGLVRQGQVRVDRDDVVRSGYGLVPGVDLEAVLAGLEPVPTDLPLPPATPICATCGAKTPASKMSYETDDEGQRVQSDICAKCARRTKRWVPPPRLQADTTTPMPVRVGISAPAAGHLGMGKWARVNGGLAREP